MKTFNHITCIVTIVLFGSCDPKLNKNSNCAEAFRGRIVSTTNPCAGVAIQILSERVPPGIADQGWNGIFQTSDNISPYVFTNVFKIYPCDVENGINNDLLKYDEVTGGFLNKRDFFFYITSDSSLENSNDGCSICKPLVSLPNKRNKIALSTDCNDLIEIED